MTLHGMTPGEVIGALTRGEYVLVSAEQLTTLREAFGIGFVSWDGDHWYASKDAQGESGHTYEDAERIMSEAQAILAALREQP